MGSINQNKFLVLFSRGDELRDFCILVVVFGEKSVNCLGTWTYKC
jgi:hypothetical protein